MRGRVARHERGAVGTGDGRAAAEAALCTGLPAASPGSLAVLLVAAHARHTSAWQQQARCRGGGGRGLARRIGEGRAGPANLPRPAINCRAARGGRQQETGAQSVEWLRQSRPLICVQCSRLAQPPPPSYRQRAAHTPQPTTGQPGAFQLQLNCWLPHARGAPAPAAAPPVTECVGASQPACACHAPCSCASLRSLHPLPRRSAAPRVPHSRLACLAGRVAAAHAPGLPPGLPPRNCRSPPPAPAARALVPPVAAGSPL